MTANRQRLDAVLHEFHDVLMTSARFSASQPRDEDGKWTKVGYVKASDSGDPMYGIGAETGMWMPGRGTTDIQFSYNHPSTQAAAEGFAADIAARKRKKARAVKVDDPKYKGTKIDVFDIEVWIPAKKKRS